MAASAKQLPAQGARRGCGVGSVCTLAQVHYAWVVTCVTFLTLVIGAGVRATPGVLIAALEQEFGWSRALISGAVSINILLYGMVGPFAAALMLSFGVTRMMLAAMCLLTAGVALSSLVSSAWHLYVLWGLVVGCGSGVVAGVLGAVVADAWFVSRKGVVMGLFSASTSSGQLVFAPALAAIVESGLGWRVAVWVMGGAAALACPLIAWLMRDSPATVGLHAYGALPQQPAVEEAEACADSTKPARGRGDAGLGEGSQDGDRSDPSDGVERDAMEPPGAENATDASQSAALAAPASPTPEALAPTDENVRTAVRSIRGPITAAMRALRFGSTNKDFLLLAGSFWVCGASTNGLIATHLIPACVDHGISEVTAAGLLSTMGVLDVVGTLASGWLSDRKPPQWLLCWYYLLRGLSLLALPWAFEANMAGLWPFAVVFGLDWIATVPPTKRLCDSCFGALSTAAATAHAAASEDGSTLAAAGASGDAATPAPLAAASGQHDSIEIELPEPAVESPTTAAPVAAPAFHPDARFARPSIMFGWCLAAHQVGAAMAAAGAGAARTGMGNYSTAFWASGGLCMFAAAMVLRIGR
jgi:cyanate permease